MVDNCPENVLGGRESISWGASFDSHSSSDLRPSSMGAASWVVGLVSVALERATLEGHGLGTSSSSDLVGIAPFCDLVYQVSGLRQSWIYHIVDYSLFRDDFLITMRLKMVEIFEVTQDLLQIVHLILLGSEEVPEVTVWVTGGISLLSHNQLFTTQTFKPFFRCDRALTIHCTMHVCACGLVAGAL